MKINKKISFSFCFDILPNYFHFHLMFISSSFNFVFQRLIRKNVDFLKTIKKKFLPRKDNNGTKRIWNFGSVLKINWWGCGSNYVLLNKSHDRQRNSSFYFDEMLRNMIQSGKIILTMDIGITTPKMYNIQCFTVDLWYGCISDSSLQKNPLW